MEEFKLKVVKIKMDVKLEHLDFWRFYMNQYLNFTTLFYFLFCLGLFGLAVLLFLSDNSFVLNQIIGLIALSLLFSFVFIFLLIYQLAETATSKENVVKYVITNKNIEIITEEATSQVNWNYFQRIKETKNHFFMNMKNGQKIMIPKKDFVENEKLLAFRDLLRTRLGNEAYLKTSKKTLNLK